MYVASGYRGLGDYDRRAPANAASLPRCATAAERAAAHTACRPISLRGLGAADLLARFGGANPCWIETLPLCPPATSAPHLIEPVFRPRAPVKPATSAPRILEPIHAPTLIESHPQPPSALPAPPELDVTGPVPAAPPPLVTAPPPVEGGMSTGSILLLVGAAGVGAWYLFGRKKRKAA